MDGPEDNRFKRVYLEYKKEKELERNIIKPQYDNNNRFSCLKDNYVPVPVNQALNERGRFDLKDTNYSSYPTNQIYNSVQNTRFISERPALQTHYLPRQAPPRATAIVLPRPPPPLTFQSNYHFPELGKKQEVPSKLKQEVKLPESKPVKEMITNQVILPINKEKIVVLSWNKGTLTQKVIYEDGTDILESNNITVKRPAYTSWASVLNPLESKNNVEESTDSEKKI